MTKEFWFNLPVKDIKKSKAFFKSIGFKSNPTHEDADHLASFFIGDKNVVMMLFPEDTFRRFINHPIVDTSKATEALFNIDAHSREEVESMAKKVEASGGTIYEQPTEVEEWMYLSCFEDLDGHSWCVLYMDKTKMPK